MNIIPFNWMGGKSRIAPQIVDLIPEHRVYVEPFCGSAAVLFAKPPSRVEVINDLDEQVINFFRVLRDREKTNELTRLVALTPFSRVEYMAAFTDNHDDDIELARRFLIKNKMRYGSNHGSFVTSVDQNYAAVWGNLPPKITAAAQRLKHCLVEQRDALELIQQYDQDGVFLYIDPPYLFDTRTSSYRYDHEMDEQGHIILVELLNNLQHAKFALSGYTNDLYDDFLAHKERHTMTARTHFNHKRTEVLWLNYQTQGLLGL